MRLRLAFVALASTVLCLGCGADTLAPVMTADGLWTGTQNGYSMSLNMTQTGTNVTGVAAVAGVGGALEGTLTGTFVYPNLNVTISVEGEQDFVYAGVMSTSEAKIDGHLNGSGFNNLEFDIVRK
jgi:hypothetical protein